MQTKSISWTTGSGNITLTYNGQGDGDITVSSDPNDLSSVRSQVINIETTAGSPVIVKNLTITQGACPVPVGTVLNYAYTGSYQEITLPAGRYKLQCWGAQGGSNASASSYGITANAGGKGGYSEGVITLSSPTTVRVYVGGAGSSSAGGFNGGGSTTGSSSYNSGNEQGVSRMGGGGGATDIRLSDAALLSRMIVAGGGSGGAMCYKSETSTISEYVTVATCIYSKWKTIATFNSDNANIHTYISSHSGYGYAFTHIESLFSNGKTYRFIYESGTVPKEVYIDYNKGGSWRATLTTSTSSSFTFNSSYVSDWEWIQFCFIYDSESDAGVLRLEEKESNDSVTVGWNDYGWGPSRNYTNAWYADWPDITALGISAGDTIRVVTNPAPISTTRIGVVTSSWGNINYKDYYGQSTCDYTIPNNSNIGIFLIRIYEANSTGQYSGNVEIKILRTSTSTTEERTPKVGYVGGGTNGGGYNSTYYGKQNGAGNNGSFGQGAAQSVTNYRYCSGAGGGGWYGGGSAYSDSSMDTCKYSGGGSGFVNTSASAGNRPSGYTGLQLDSGTTYAGEQSFPAVGGGNETGHSGNGYARITRLYTDVTDFEYTGAVQSKTLSAGTYMIECWGAQGGSYNGTYYGGKGGYSVGKLTLSESTTVYVYVGGQGTGGTTAGAKAGGFNGGGLGYSTSTTYIECGGGGASDVRIGQDSLYARVIVAGGGGGAGSYSSSYRYAGGAGGGTSGATPSQYSTSYRAGTGGTQTARGNSYYGSTANSATYGTLAGFGVGAGANSGTTSYQITGGGAGWYGGGYSRRGAAGGGSGYVYNASTASNYPSGCLLNSEYYLADAETKAGNTSIPSTSYGTETGHEGNGYVRITKIS